MYLKVLTDSSFHLICEYKSVVYLHKLIAHIFEIHFLSLCNLRYFTKTTAAEVLERIMNLPSDDSGDESGRDSDVEDIEQQLVQENEENEESEESEEELEAADAGQMQEEMELAGERLPM